MRVLYVNKSARVTGGADRHCLDAIEALRAAGHDVHLLAAGDMEGSDSGKTLIRGRVTRDSRSHLTLGVRARVAAEAFWNPAAAAATVRAVSDFRPEVVHVHKLYPQLSVAPVVIASRRGIPVVQTIHDYEFISASPYDAGGDWRDRVEHDSSARVLNTALGQVRRAWHVPRVATWIAVSEALAKVVRDRAGISPRVVRNFTTTPPSSPLSRWARGPIAFVGRLSAEKGLDLVLEVARRMPECEFNIVGDGPMRDQAIAASTNAPNISYLGWLPPERCTDILGTAALALMPSRWPEPAGLVALEAMAVGTPVVAAGHGGLGEYVRGSKAGVVERIDAPSLVTACRLLLEDEQLWTECSRNGLRAIGEDFSSSRYVAEITSIYQDAVNSVPTLAGSARGRR